MFKDLILSESTSGPEGKHLTLHPYQGGRRGPLSVLHCGVAGGQGDANFDELRSSCSKAAFVHLRAVDPPPGAPGRSRPGRSLPCMPPAFLQSPPFCWPVPWLPLCPLYPVIDVEAAAADRAGRPQRGRFHSWLLTAAAPTRPFLELEAGGLFKGHWSPTWPPLWRGRRTRVDTGSQQIKAFARIPTAGGDCTAALPGRHGHLGFVARATLGAGPSEPGVGAVPWLRG